MTTNTTYANVWCMKKIIFTAAITCAALAGFFYGTSERVYENENFSEKFKADVHRIMALTQLNLKDAQLQDGSKIGEKADNLPNPLVSYEIARHIYDIAHLSALGEQCILNWKEDNYLPFMAYLRHHKKMTEYQMAYAGIMHGMIMSMYKRAAKSVDCEKFSSNIQQKFFSH